MSLSLAGISSLVQDEINEVEKIMIAQAEEYNLDFKAALDLLLSSGGKRIRPTIILLLGKILHGNSDYLISAAAAIELLHTATLVHDDLIDGAILRRGMPTLNSRWSSAATVLTGDFIFSRAAVLITEANSLPAMKLFGKTLSIIVDGEVTQLFTGHCTADRENYYRRIYSKTASLFETSATSAALVSLADATIVDSVAKYGYHLGMAFQIIDDILDFTSQQEHLGKPVGSDVRQGLITLPLIYYSERYPETEFSQKIRSGICPEEVDIINNLIDTVVKSDCLILAHEEAKEFSRKAIDYLSVLPDQPETQALMQLSRYIVDRDM
ncbi:MAG: polyprenyl synthetase family protein [Anaerolineae bacterium]|nr:polyprenyl synthetase family protein [Anaerolineae bacterium]